MVNRKKEKTSFFYADCEDMNTTWTSYEKLIEFDEMWEKGVIGEELAKHFNKTLDEIAIHVIDRASKGKISKRKNGIWG